MVGDVLYTRLRAICCATWGIPPWAFDEAVAQERVAAEDAIEAAMVYAAGSFGGDVFAYLFREKAASRRRRLERMKQLVAEYRVTHDASRRAQLEAEMEKLNQE